MRQDVITFLIKFSHGAKHHPNKLALAMFPARPHGYVAAARDIGNYAINRAMAMNLEDMGDINGAEKYNKICEFIASHLPEFAKPWAI